MSIGLVGYKLGMSRLFTEAGHNIPVTVIEAIPNIVTQIKNKEVDQYSALQVTFGTRKDKRTNKAMQGHVVKSKAKVGAGFIEFRCEDMSDIELGTAVSVAQFKVGQKVDVSGVSKGKGFAGPVKRWNFSMQDATHGNSLSHRAHGSTGQCQDPGRVFKGKKMAGHLGNRNATTQNLEVVQIDLDRHLILIKGAVPGATGTKVVICPAMKGQKFSQPMLAQTVSEISESNKEEGIE